MLIFSYRKSFSWKAFAKERDLLPSEVWELGDADLFLPRESLSWKEFAKERDSGMEMSVNPAFSILTRYLRPRMMD
jgi:hypothetical protein